MGRKLGTRISEHKKEYETSVGEGVKTRTTRSASQSDIHKSAITDHMVHNNHIPNWSDVSVEAQEDIYAKRTIQESIHIRKHKTFNRDEGGYKLSHIFDDIIPSARKTMEAKGTSHP
jgi:hypothetical protein